MESLLANFSEAHRLLAYLVIFLVVLVEGEIILLLAGILARHGYLSFLAVFVIAFTASIFHDFIYWRLGKYLADSGKKKFLFFDLGKAGDFFATFRGGNGFYIFISKFAWGLTRVALVAGGYLKMNLQDIWRYTIPAGFLWTISLISLGYVFASETNLLRKDVRTALLLATLFVLIVFTLEYLLRKSLKKNQT